MSYKRSKIEKMLPKTYLRKRVAHEINVALAHFPDLQPTMGRYVYNDGTIKDLITLAGILPVTFDDKTYNIPVCLWLEESYPQTAPICYVKPTPEMFILTGHYITSNGEVLLPYMDEWKPGQCDLVTLLQVMTAVFGEVPPLCMQRTKASCYEQFRTEAEVLSRTDGSFYLSLAKDDDQRFHRENETTC